MSSINEEKRSWRQTLSSWMQPKVVSMLFLGFSAGIPILLIFSTLSLWLTEAGVAKASVTFFSWAALGYSFKFVWAPIIDRMPLPFLTGFLGRRRAWLLVAQLCVISAITLMACIDPSADVSNLTTMAIAAVLLGFSSATQDIVIDAYRIESVNEELQALLAAMYIAGYRIAMLVAGAGALFIAEFLGSTGEVYNYEAWRYTYLAMAGVMLLGVVTTLTVDEPENNKSNNYDYSMHQYVRFFVLFILVAASFATTFFWTSSIFSDLKANLLEFSSWGEVITFFLACVRFFLAVAVAGMATWIGIKVGIVDRKMAIETYVVPIMDFFDRYGIKAALLLFALVSCYRVSDIVLGVITNVFYHDMGFSKYTIGAITKGYGVGMTILGGFLGGFLTLRYGVYKILFLGALLSAATNLLFMALASGGADITMLTIVISLDNLSGGIAATAFVAFLSGLTSRSFTAIQYALFTSVMTLFPKLLGGYSGAIATSLGYSSFFLLTAVMGIPVLLLVWKANVVVNKEHSRG